MRILGLDTSGAICSVGIMDNGEIISEVSVHDKNTHSVNLMPLVDEALKQCGLSPKDIEAYAVNAGPGSFTGIRIGVCSVMGLALSPDTPCVGVNTLESLAYNAEGYTGNICALIDARRTECYWALFCADGKGIIRVSDDGAETVTSILSQLPDGEICFVGDGAVNYRGLIEETLGARAKFLSEKDMMPQAGSVLKAAAKLIADGQMTSVYDLEPYYIRSSQAERLKAHPHG